MPQSTAVIGMEHTRLCAKFHNMFLLSRFHKKRIWTSVTENSATRVPIAAPVAPSFGIKIAFMVMLHVAPTA